MKVKWRNLRYIFLAAAITYLILLQIGLLSSPDYPWILLIVGWLYMEARENRREIRENRREIRENRQKIAKHIEHSGK